ncbi:hypothetical protein CEXT_447091 [Caerostris extrusa]|uniref:Transmembrane protein n=1 Tax=Caerostris extrusa TaxID=172846 RepID=A0AAV4Y6F1_CAEEX|nr:hypothetical protein CEXT_447091 [Caerostris extrusa]
MYHIDSIRIHQVSTRPPVFSYRLHASVNAVPDPYHYKLHSAQPIKLHLCCATFLPLPFLPWIIDGFQTSVFYRSYNDACEATVARFIFVPLASISFGVWILKSLGSKRLYHTYIYERDVLYLKVHYCIR